jgi:putative sigma-54 modulation protein
MQLDVKGKNLEVSDAIRDYAQRKLRKLERRLHDSTRVELELAVERNPSIADSQVAEANIHVKGRTLRAREAAPDMKAAIDELVDKLVRQVTDLHEKRVDGRKRAPAGTAGEAGGAQPEDSGAVQEPAAAEEAELPENPVEPS